MKEILESILQDLPYDVLTEYKFSINRKFRLDYFIDLTKYNCLINGIGIEYEGISYQDSNTSRHTNTSGFIQDIDKYNLALSLGVPVLRYTFKQLEDPEQVKKQIIKILDNFLTNINFKSQ